MSDNIDWEDMMTKTERSATAAALNAERAVGGVAKALEIQRHHSQQLASLKKAMEAVENQPSAHPSPMNPPANNAQGAAEVHFRYLALGVAVALVVGMGFGVYIAS